jgi:hypothetical protein
MRYDNNQWKVVAHHHKIDFDTLKVDSKNKVWAMKAYGQHLYFFENNTWDSIAFNDTMKQATTFNIDRNGIPIVVAIGFLWQLEKGEFKRISYRTSDSTYLFFSNVVFDTKNNWYAYNGNTTIIINPHENPVRLEFPNAGKFKGVDSLQNIYFWKDSKLSIYKESVLINQIAPTIPNNYTPNIIIQDAKDIYFLFSSYSIHYNGTQFDVDSNQKEVINGNAFIDNIGRFWKSTGTSIIMKSKDSIIEVKPQDLGLRSVNVSDVIKQGNDYIITYYDSLPTLFRNSKYIHYDSIYITSPLRDIIKSSENELWGKGNDTLYHYKNKKWNKYKLNGSSVYVDALCRTNVGGAAVFSKDKLILIKSDSTSIVNFPFKSFLPPWQGGAIIHQDKKGTFWLSLNKQGLYKYENNSWTEYNEDNTSKQAMNFIFSMDIDSAGYLYGTCGIFGLLKYDGYVFRLLDTTNSNTNFISKVSVGIDHNNKVWCGDYEKGMEYFDGVNFHILDIDFNHQIHRTWVDDNNDKWFLSDGLISIYNEKDDPIPPVIPASETIDFYPNPTTESITIRNLLSDDRIQLYDLMGRKLIDFYPLKDGNQQVNLTAISRGLYLLNIDRKNQPYFQAKVMKE